MVVLKKIFLVLVIFSLNNICYAENGESRIPDSVREILRNTSDDVFVGVGVAKTESDEESILLAEDRAREEISIELNILLEGLINDYSGPDNNFILNETLNEYFSSIILNSNVILREKDENGNWWCVVTAHPHNRNPEELKTLDEEFERYSNSSDNNQD